ncbi:efflux transporter outer membrane subunit [Burkholderia sp. Bp9143]|uniref:efflux transporter outer membrane subunit n=1 Tax=Burkholderia sp. Bp9143 TaxID=2184574 RepID=UPI0021AB52FD|nr:efflux transporter outer membrane subunit [Burkholderia sp. Bp9143]
MLAAILLAACASSSGLRTRAEAIDPQNLEVAHSLSSVSFSTAAWPTDAWWTDLGDDQLNRFIRDGLQGQPSLHVAEARVRAAQAVSGIVEAALYPQINASATSARLRFSEKGTVPPPIAGTWQTVNDATLGVSYEFDFWGKNRAAMEAALDHAHATEVDLQAARLVLTTTLTRTYLRLDAAYDLRDLAESTLKQREQTLALTRRRVAAQIDSELELTQAEAALPAARERIVSLNESIALLDNQLAALQGKGPDAGLVIQRPHLAKIGIVQLPTDLPVELIGRRPDVVAGRWRVEAARRDIKVARAQFYPNISLNAFVGLQRLGFDDFLSAGSRVIGIGPAVSLPIFDGGRRRGNLALKQAVYDESVETYNATLIDALHDVVDQLVSLRWLEAQETEQNQALQLAQHAYDLAIRQYRNGVANYLQVLIAESQVLLQKRLVIESRARDRELRLNLIRALGGGYVPTASPDPRVADES